MQTLEARDLSESKTSKVKHVTKNSEVFISVLDRLTERAKQRFDVDLQANDSSLVQTIKL